MLNQQPNQPLPDTIRVLAIKGFRGLVNNVFGIANPGDVVNVPRLLAMELRGAGKAMMSDAPLRTQDNYLPERKRGGAAMTPAERQLKALTDAVAALQTTVSTIAAAKK